MAVQIEHGDCLNVMARLRDEGVTVQSAVTDPPYHLTSIVKRFGGDRAAAVKVPAGGTGAYARASAGFMGQKWDGGDVAFRPETWRLVFDLLPPGGHLLAFSGTRTYHRMACAVEDAGFEIRDMISWLYGSGFPKSHNQKDEWEGWGTALKPACEPIVMARKPLSGTVAATVTEHGTGALNVDGCRVGMDISGWGGKGAGGKTWNAKNCGLAKDGQPRPVVGRWPANVVHDGCLSEDWGRYFYTAKADAADRLGSKHPTVKPVDLMAWLVRMVTPPGGTVLDPFAGSGTTGMACLREGFDGILIEREAAYVADIRRRLDHVRGADTPLFVG